MSGQTCFAAFAQGLLGIDGAENDSKERWSTRRGIDFLGSFGWINMVVYLVIIYGCKIPISAMDFGHFTVDLFQKLTPFTPSVLPITLFSFLCKLISAPTASCCCYGVYSWQLGSCYLISLLEDS